MNERFLERGDRRYAVLEADPADPSAVRLLALHGFLDHGGSFGPLADAVSECHWVAPDLPGHGASPHYPRGQEYPFLDFTWDAVNVADALEWRRLTLVGHSMGGGLALMLAAALPDRIDRLVLLDSAGPLCRPSGETAEQLGRALRHLSARRGDRRRSFPSVEVARETLLSQVPISATAADALLPRALERTDHGWRWRADPRLKTPSLATLSEDQVVEAVKAISCPVLLITGSDSGLMRANRQVFAHRMALVAQLTQTELVGGHHVHLDNPGGCAAAIRDFIRTTPLPA